MVRQHLDKVIDGIARTLIFSRSILKKLETVYRRIIRATRL